MFGSLKSIWNESGVVASVDGVLREAQNGNALEVQKWYYKLKKDAYKQARELGISPVEAEMRALTAIESTKLEAYQDILRQLRQPGGVLAEIDSWLEKNNPV